MDYFMLEKPNALQTLGVELSTSGLKAARIVVQRGQARLEHLFNLPLDDQHKHHSGHHVNPLYTTEEGKLFSQFSEKDLVVSTLNANEVLVRQLEIKLKKERDIDAVLTFQAEPILPYPVENAIVDRIKVEDTADGTLLTVLAVRKDHMKHHIEQWPPFQLEPEVVSCVPAALAEFSKASVPDNIPHYVLHLGQYQTCCIYVRDGKLIAAQSSAHGIQNLKQALFKDYPDIDPAMLEMTFKDIHWEDLSSLELPTLQETVEHFRMELTRTVFALGKLTKGNEVTHILVTGEGSALPKLADTLVQGLNKTQLTPVFLIPSLVSLSELPAYAVPIGAALSALPEAKDQVNFRQDDFAYPNPWKRLKHPLAIFAGLCLLAAGAMYFFGQSYTSYKEDQARSEYAQLLTIMNKPYPEFEKELAAKQLGAKAAETFEVQPLKSLSAYDLMYRIQVLEKELQSTPDLFPLLPNVPRVSDVLSWLSNHPKAVVKDPKTNTSKPLITIDNFSYTMVKRPDMSKKQEKYQVKVEIEFSTPNPTVAREFHDALIAPNDFVDPKGDVKWNTTKGKYRATFFLKDKTTYP